MIDSYTQLENLMAEKPFANLSKTEKNWVKQYISTANYEAQREILLAVQQELAELPLPSKQLEINLMQAFSKHHGVARFSIIKLGKALLWAATLAAVFLLGRWSQASPVESTQPNEITVHTIYKTKRDTVYIEKPAPLPINTHTYTHAIIRDTVYISRVHELPIATNTTELMPILEVKTTKLQSSNVNDNQEIYNILVDVY